jgi:uncharacterized protein
VHQLTKAQARRIAVRAQLLDAARPMELVSLVERLTLLQIDPTAAIAPSADLVAWSRPGSDSCHWLSSTRSMMSPSIRRR